MVLSIEKGPKERRVMMLESKREAESGSKIRFMDDVEKSCAFFYEFCTKKKALIWNAVTKSMDSKVCRVLDF